jgi:D-alanine-D-alanine ligase
LEFVKLKNIDLCFIKPQNKENEMGKRRCCIIYNKPGSEALADELDVIEQVDFVEKNLIELEIDTYRKSITSDFMSEVAQLIEEKPDFVFNLVESINNKGELNYFVPALLNLNSISYSGNPLEAIFMTTNKILSGRTMLNAGIASPRSVAPSQMHLLKPGSPYIIKPIWEDGSLGITEESVFTFSEDYRSRLQIFDDSHWTIQEYIDGREFNLSVIAGDKGPEVMPPAEILFTNDWEQKPKIINFKAKWEEDSFEYVNTVRDFPGQNLNSALRDKMIETAYQCWHLFGLKGYARVDMRTDSNNVPHVIEVNANPCISPEGGFIAATKMGGLSSVEVIRRIINDLNK